MDKDKGIKIFFVVLLLFSVYLLITGIITPGEEVFNNDNGEVLEEQLQLSTYMLNMKIGETYQVTATILPDNATDKTVTWLSGNPGIVMVDNGNVKAVGSGKTIIKVTSNKTHIVKMINVTVESDLVEIEKINVETESVELYVGDKASIKYTLEPSNANNTKISFLTSNKDVAGFDESGNIVGVNAGETTITLKSNNGITANIKVTVKQKEIEVTGVKVDKKKTTLTEGETKELTASVVPSNASNQTLTWSSSNNNIVTVDDGKLKAIKEGTATVKVTSYNGKYKEVTVVVKPKEVIYPAITDDSKYHKGTVVATHTSATLKYRIQSYGNNDYVLVWVKDANKQWNSALPELGKAFKAETLLSSEVSSYGYQSKGLVATNGGFFWDGWGDSPCTVFIINKGKVIRDLGSTNKRQYGVFGITKDGEIKTYGFSASDSNNNQKVKQQLINDGVRNTFTMVGTIIDRDGSMSTDTGGTNNRTVLCEVNKNNFVIYSGGSLPFGGIAKELKNSYGCKMAVNLDGGGSRKLYYKVGSGSITRRFGGDRAVPDMMYFVEQ